MKQRILFVSIFDLTCIYYAVAKKLESAGHQVFWITTNQYWTAWLVEHGIKRSVIQELVYKQGDSVLTEERDKLMRDLVRTEADSELTINQVLQMDQFVMNKNRSDINDLVLLYYRDIRGFIADNDITHVFAEPTNTNEMITYMVCRERGIPFMSARDMRYPLGRLIFNEGYLQEVIVGGNDEPNRASGQELIDTFMRQEIKPYYFEKNSKVKAIDPNKIVKAFRNRLARMRYSSGLTHHEFQERIGLAVRRALNGFYMKHYCQYDDLNAIIGRIAYYGLHVQPEASIDVLGSYYSDQLKLIKDIRRALPFDMTLVVKEHPNFLGIKPIRIFREIKRLPNVKLVHHSVSSFDIYRRSDLVLTVSGTTAYEAGMLGLQAITFSPMYFKELSSVHYCQDIVHLKDMVRDVLINTPRDCDADYRAMESMVRQSFDACWGNPISSPWLMENENVNKLGRAFLSVIESTAREQEIEPTEKEVMELSGCC